MPAARCAAVLAATRPTVAYGLITAIYAINKYAETSTACSNTLSEVEFVRCSFAMLVSYMPLAVYFRAQNKSPTAHASATVNDASRINASRTRRTASAATSCTAGGGRSGTSRIERARATSHPPRPEDKRRGPAAHEYRNCTREAARSRRIATNSTVRRADYGWTSLDGARVESGGGRLRLSRSVGVAHIIRSAVPVLRRRRHDGAAARGGRAGGGESFRSASLGRLAPRRHARAAG